MVLAVLVDQRAVASANIYWVGISWPGVPVCPMRAVSGTATVVAERLCKNDGWCEAETREIQCNIWQ